ncbi:hypothetical protein GOA91_07655 [Sinorhizobium meliloti]|uniref:hypothetical protein n=1 Tax=Rhizobium meliloti TaxID=382 RepID=UPI000FDA4EFA|nr:hypothetical protein [Sinorhizobium meliloti]MDW9802793.1 hypothetical protein [Sinorhizobium meliloti]MDW9908852.1 hypothetical protein [Sinorhizobium meliloti]MDX0273456.1 hypothetical protein [Sinorhizobium meliloti]RVI61831.1 hypothetical protein CN189_20320 [Sinorhizobium meliloti]
MNLKISRDEFDNDRHYALWLSADEVGRIVARLSEPGRGTWSNEMLPDEALAIFRQHEQMRRLPDVSFVVIDDDGLWKPHWGEIRRPKNEGE